ncbi:MAG: hypothetical protein WKF84_05910 [Pyrinomonadaceae bacterium]
MLHPIKECAGKTCVVKHDDGSLTASLFPFHVSPDQPFLDIRAISHELTKGFWADVVFEGEIFEMEDQRNWTDASYKTYCTPLRLALPVLIAKGRCHHAILSPCVSAANIIIRCLTLKATAIV